MASHPLRRNTASSSGGGGDYYDPPMQLCYTLSSEPLSVDNNISSYSEDDDELSGGYPAAVGYNDNSYDAEEDDLNSEAREYYNSGASELVTTVRGDGYGGGRGQAVLVMGVIRVEDTPLHSNHIIMNPMNPKFGEPVSPNNTLRIGDNGGRLGSYVH